MKLYSNRFAASPRRTRMYLAEKQLAFEIVEIDLAAGQNRTPEYLAKNPLGELPTLELDDGRLLTESMAICRHVESLYPEPPLYGRSPEERYEIERWAERLMFRLYVPLTAVFRNTHKYWAGRIEQVPAYGELARRAVEQELLALDAQLQRQEFVAGDRFSVADIVGFTSVDFGKPSGIRVTDATPALKRWYEAIGARPSTRV